MLLVRRPFALALASISISLVSVPTFAAQGRRLNGPLARPTGGDIFALALSPDGSRVVYTADQDVDEVVELYAADSAGGQTPIKLSGPMVAGGSVARTSGFLIGPRGRRVVYLADQEVDGVQELFGVALDGGPTIKLNPPGKRASTPSIAPNGARVVYLADGPEPGTHYQLYSSPVAGGTPVELSASRPALTSVSAFKVSLDSRRVVYRADPDQAGRAELFSVPIGGGPVVALGSGPAPSAGSFALDARGVVFVGKPASELFYALYRAPLDGSAPPRRLNPGDVQRLDTLDDPPGFLVAPDGVRVLYRGERPGVNALFSVPLDGPGANVELLALGADEQLGSVRITSDSRFALLVLFRPFVIDARLVRVALDASSPPVVLSHSVSEFELTPDGSVAVTTARFPFPSGLFSVRVDGSTAPVRIGPGADALALTSNGQRVVFRAPGVLPQASELFSVPIAGGVAPTRLNAPLPPGGGVGDFALRADDRRVLYLADQFEEDRVELFSVVADGRFAPQAVSGPLPGGPVEGDVLDFELAPGGAHAVYRADQDANDRFELFAVHTRGRTPPVRLHDPLAPWEGVAFDAFTPDGGHVVFSRFDGPSQKRSIAVVPVEGGPAVLLSTSLSTAADAGVRALVTPDGTRAVYQEAELVGGVLRRALFARALDGSAPAVPITRWQPSDAPLVLAFVTADGARLVYAADLGITDFEATLFSVLLDGSAPPVELALRVRQTIQSSPDGTRVVFIADPQAQNRIELDSVPVDGSLSPVRLDAGGLRDTRPQLAGAFAYFLADSVGNGVIELYRADLGGGTPPVKISGALVAGGDVGFFRVSPDGTRVAYQADQDRDEQYEVYSTASDGSTAPVKLNRPLGPRADVTGFLGDDRDVVSFSPDGARVVFRANRFGGSELFSVPSDGSAAPLRLTQLGEDDYVFSGFKFGPDGRLTYFAHVDGAGLALFQAQLDRAHSSRRISGFGTEMQRFFDQRIELHPATGQVVYLLDEKTRGVLELFRTDAGPRDAGEQPAPASTSR